MSDNTPTESRAAHTPGPWYALEPENLFGWWVVATDPEGVDLLDPSLGGGFTEANARLIAAAPDMLAALQGLLNHYVDLVNCGDCGNWDPEQEPVVTAARTAIAKAEGRQ